jgi:hypothetical protein
LEGSNLVALISILALSDEGVDAVLEELETGSPRAAAIVAASFVETHLEHLIFSRMVDDSKLKTLMFGPNGALGTFSAKINLGYLTGIYSKNAWKELDTIRSVRNDFAHRLDISFDNGSVRDRCTNLVLWEKWQITVTSADESESGSAKPFSLEFFDKGTSMTPRLRYQTACRFFIAAFSLLMGSARDQVAL